MYIGNLGLLRTGELLSLRVSQVTDYADTGCVVLSLPNSKGAKRKNVGEFVTFTDIHARMLLQRLVAGKAAADSVFGLSCTDWRRPWRPLGCLGTLLRLTLCGGVGPPTISRALRRWISLRLTAAFAGTARCHI